MNDLEKFFFNAPHRMMQKDAHYFEVYERYFGRYRNKQPVVLEFGVSEGGSLQMWKYYFGEGAKIFGADINPECRKLEEENVQIFIGSQDDASFLETLAWQLPPLDIVIDDGGHTMQQQKLTFKHFFPKLKEDGLYVCEDAGTSYWPSFYGGYKRKSTFIEFCKTIIDTIHLNLIPKNFSSRRKELHSSIHGIHFYESVVVIEKRKKIERKNFIIGDKMLTQDFSFSKKYRYNLVNLWYRLRQHFRI